MYTFSNANISKENKIVLVKLFKNIRTVLNGVTNDSDEARENAENLLIYTIKSFPAILYVNDEETNESIISLVVKHKFWGAVFEIAKLDDFREIINKNIEKNKSKEKQA